VCLTHAVFYAQRTMGRNWILAIRRCPARPCTASRGPPLLVNTELNIADGGGHVVSMGVKSVGTSCERTAAADWADPGSYVVGMQPLPGDVPGLGHFDWDLRKVSVPVPTHLADDVLKDRRPDLMRLVPIAADAAGGFADGCHRLAAAATIPGDATAAFIQALARVAEAG